ncbi:TrkA domain protein [Methanomicrobium sp. W14]|uniref:cation:proton antiporter regulatory subunit n=1 Tax=Methanomicrobium sp. W14 TaxID=2817839 RepID=UPI001AE2E7F1|nr:cation:proton antiporter regulatory subunit [Methanomicrobium sp. W14]MBP2133417.1 TrkA domain protein [Methanomicrobium sp. W14]
MGFSPRDLPGIGTKYEMDTESGDRLSVVYMEKGGVQMYIASRDGVDSASAELNTSEARRVGNVLTGAVFEADEEEISVIFSSFSDLSIKVHTYILGAKTAKKSLFDLKVRSKTGVTIVAVNRKGESIVNPPSDFCLDVGDSVLVIGDSTQLEKFEEEYIKP